MYQFPANITFSRSYKNMHDARVVGGDIDIAGNEGFGWGWFVRGNGFFERNGLLRMGRLAGGGGRLSVGVVKVDGDTFDIHLRRWRPPMRYLPHSRSAYGGRVKSAG